MKISNVHIKNYKSIRDSGSIEIDDNIMAFIGQNNAGKSAILDAIQCLFPSSKKTVSTSDFHKGTSEEIEIAICFTDVTDEYLYEKICYEKVANDISKIQQLKNSGELLVDIEKKENKLKEKIENNMASIKETYQIKDELFYIKLTVKNMNKLVTSYYVGEDHTTTIKEIDLKKILPVLKVIPAIRDPKNESTAGSNSYLKELIALLDENDETSISISGQSVTYKDLNTLIAKESENRCKEISNTITDYYNEALGVDDFEVVVNSDVNISKGTTYYTKIIDKNTKIESDILSCGTGYQSMIILSILEAYVKLVKKKQDYILIIEEPEVYLHPSLQRKMIDTLLLISERNQILFSSHSPITVAKMKKNQIKLVRREYGEATISNINVSEVLHELGIKADDILVNKAIVLVEGIDDKKIIECILEKIEPGASEYVNVLNTGSCTNLKFYANAELLINNKLNIPFLVIRDSDAMNVGERKNNLKKDILSLNMNLTDQQLEIIDNSIFIVPHYSIEGYFVNEHFLKQTGINEVYMSDMIRCYNCQYNHYSEGSTESCRKTIANWYQPKHLLENFEDKFNAKEEEKKAKHKIKYEEFWRKFEKCNSCPHSIDNFFLGRDELNRFTHDKKIKKEDYLISFIKDLSIDELNNTSLNGLVLRLTKLLEEK